ncbi:MAG: polyphosphate polymerase domain-containing protein [Firmicutes bacterium]|nr:polyphosphate polymerase domain-containing protein [Bacillota bacterium]
MEQNKQKKWRHEKKFQISLADYLALSQKLKLIMKPDAHTGPDGRYRITSTYFDNIYDKALNEKRYGVSEREKFRIRYYNDDKSLINLEKKEKRNGLCSKSKGRLSEEEVDRILSGDWQFLKEHPDPVCRELGIKMETQLLRSKSTVSYIREPYIYEPGNVRVTFDFLEAGPVICEVKYDEFLPTVLSAVLSEHLLRLQAFSKYQHSRTAY